MSSRTKEKERRRQERIAAEQAATRSASRKRTLRIAGAAILGLVVIAVIVVVATAGGGGSSGGGDSSALAADARAAGCTFKSYPSEGRRHTSGKGKYKTNPPTSGPHNPVPAPDGIYAPGNEPAPENAVHSLEHGRVLFEYKPGTPTADVDKLRSLAESEFNGTPAYHTLMFRNNTNMPTQFAVVAWTKLLTCDRLTAQAEDVMRQFRQTYTDKGPEFIP
jgi:Protein of unknown function (DUF3105)